MVSPPGKVLPCPRGLRGSAARTRPDEPSPKTFTEVRGRRSHKSHVLHSAPSSPSHFTLSRAALGRHCQSGQTPSLGLPWQLSGRGCACKTPRGQRGVRGCRGQARQLPAQIGGSRFAPAQAGAFCREIFRSVSPCNDRPPGERCLVWCRERPTGLVPRDSLPG